MIETAHVRELAARMREVVTADPPRTLPVLLGAGCAEAAGVPSYATMARDTLPRLAEVGKGPLPPPDTAPDEDWVEVFKGYLSGLLPVQRYKVFEPYYRVLPVPSFYRDLADLVVAGFVTHVLTTNVDSLLEQALDRAGLRAGTGYKVVVLGSPEPRPSSNDPDLTLVKLHGDLGESLLPVEPEEIGQVLHEQRKTFRSELLDELVVVGHRLSGSEPEPLDKWLVMSSSAPLWWASPEPPEAGSGPLADLAGTRPVRLLLGAERGTPEGLFARLSFELLGLPALRAADVVGDDVDDHRLEVEFHRSELLKTRSAALDLNEQVVPGVHDPALASELAEQRRRSAAQEEQLSNIVGEVTEDRPLRSTTDAIGRLIGEASRLDAGQSTVDFLRSCARLIRQQASGDHPDLALVQTALAAALGVAEGFGYRLSPATREGLNAAAAEVSLPPSVRLPPGGTP